MTPAHSSSSVDAVVVGAGVVGLAIGRALALQGRETLVLERHLRIGEETSSRNSGVVHSGIYYPAGSLKARLCVVGRSALYDYAERRGIAHRRCGKLIVAQDDQVDALKLLHARGLENGVGDLRWLDARDVSALEPEVRCSAGVFSPSTGIVDPAELMSSLLADLESANGNCVLGCDALDAQSDGDGWAVRVSSGGEISTVVARRLIVSAGLEAVTLCRRIRGYPIERLPEARYARGVYFTCNRRPFRHLVYPMPNEAGLGTHATLDLAGEVRFGPDVEWIDRPDYGVDDERRASFVADIATYWPGVRDATLAPAYAGVRPKITGPGQPAADFRIDGPREHGLPGLVALLGIESPGLTACLPLADEAVRRLDDPGPGLESKKHKRNVD